MVLSMCAYGRLIHYMYYHDATTVQQIGVEFHLIYVNKMCKCTTVVRYLYETLAIMLLLVLILPTILLALEENL